MACLNADKLQNDANPRISTLDLHCLPSRPAKLEANPVKIHFVMHGIRAHSPVISAILANFERTAQNGRFHQQFYQVPGLVGQLARAPPSRLWVPLYKRVVSSTFAAVVITPKNEDMVCQSIAWREGEALAESRVFVGTRQTERLRGSVALPMTGHGMSFVRVSQGGGTCRVACDYRHPAD